MLNVGKLKIGCPKDKTQDRGSEKGPWSHQTGKPRRKNRDGIDVMVGGGKITLHEK